MTRLSSRMRRIVVGGLATAAAVAEASDVSDMVQMKVNVSDAVEDNASKPAHNYHHRTSLSEHSAIEWGKYHTTDEVIHGITALVRNCGVPLEAKVVKDQQDPTKGLFTYWLGAPTATKKIMIVANEHARELITAEVALGLAMHACDASSKGIDPLKRVQLVVIPVANEAGRKVAETGDECLRYTTDAEGGFDLNRQMEVDFRPNMMEGHGEKPFDAYQARIIRDVAMREEPLAYIDLHSGARSLMTSWGARHGVSSDYAAQAKMLEVVKERHCKDCEMGSNADVIGYLNEGEIIDHMFAKLHIKYSTLWEVYAGDVAGGCKQLFNPPKAELEDVVKDWVGALLTVAEYVDGKVAEDERTSPGVLTEKLTQPVPSSLLQKGARRKVDKNSLTT